jgi:hypothetical protein
LHLTLDTPLQDVFQIYANDIDDIMTTKYKNIRIHPTFKRGGLSAIHFVNYPRLKSGGLEKLLKEGE